MSIEVVKLTDEEAIELLREIEHKNAIEQYKIKKCIDNLEYADESKEKIKHILKEQIQSDYEWKTRAFSEYSNKF